MYVIIVRGVARLYTHVDEAIFATITYHILYYFILLYCGRYVLISSNLVRFYPRDAML